MCFSVDFGAKCDLFDYELFLMLTFGELFQYPNISTVWTGPVGLKHTT